jgi:hypothetical protein
MNKPLFGEMPWVRTARELAELKKALNLPFIKELAEMALNFENLAREVQEAKAELASLKKKVSELEAGNAAEAAAYQAQIDALAAELDAAQDHGASTGGITA